MSRRPIQRFEHDVLRAGTEGFTVAQFERLAAYNDRHDSRLFVVGDRRITFTSFVGVIRVGSTTIEILPKLDRPGTAADKGRMRDLLLRMIGRSGAVKGAFFDEAELGRTKMSMLDVYLDLFLDETARIVANGLQKHYLWVQGNEPVLRGRLLVAKQLEVNAIHQERFFVEYPVYTVDGPFNRILKKALALAAKVADSDRAARARRLRDGFASVRDIPAAACLRPPVYTRQTGCYRVAVTLAQMFIAGYQPDVSTGRTPVLAMLFDMNRLFERYVAECLRRAAGPDEKVSAQVSRGFWREEPSRSKTIRPDLIVEKDGGKHVLDTKWKVPDQDGVADVDLHQMYVYGTQFAARRVYLVYPKLSGELERREGEFLAPADGIDVRPLTRLFVPLLAPASLGMKLNPALGRELLAALR